MTVQAVCSAPSAFFKLPRPNPTEKSAPFRLKTVIGEFNTVYIVHLQGGYAVGEGRGKNHPSAVCHLVTIREPSPCVPKFFLCFYHSCCDLVVGVYIIRIPFATRQKWCIVLLCDFPYIDKK